MADTEEAKVIQKLFKELKSQIKREQYSKCVNTCTKILTKVPKDPHAVKCKCVCFIHQQKFDKALDIANKYDFLMFEKAYCLYRTSKLDDALRILEEREEPGEDVLHLKAQIMYKMGKFDKSSGVYAQVMEESEEQAQSTETLANLGAAFTAADSGAKAMTFLSSAGDTDSYELLYNTACAMIQAGNFTEAEAYLRKAESCCRVSLEADEYTPEEIDQEAAVILTQLAYVLQLTGDTSKASAIYKRVLKSKPGDPAVSAAASNNTVVIRKDHDLFDSFKRIKSASSEEAQKKLTDAQKQAIALNKCLLLIYANKGDEAQQAVEAFKESYPTSDLPGLLRAAVYHRQKKISECEEVLQAYKSDEAQLTLAQMRLKQGRTSEAAQSLRNVTSLQHAPATVATLVALYKSVGDDSAALSIFDDALVARDGDGNQDEDYDAATLCIQEAAAAYKLEQGLHQEAAAAYEQIARKAGGAVKLRALASLVIALSFTADQEGASRWEASLPPLDEIDTQVQELEQTAPLRALSRRMIPVSKVQKKEEKKKAAMSPEKRAKKKAVRKEKYLAKLQTAAEASGRPFDPKRNPMPKPDPERWIPRKQRSYAKKGRNRNKFVGAQGSGSGAQKDTLKLDARARQEAKAAGLLEETKPTGRVNKGKSASERRSNKKKKGGKKGGSGW